MFGPNQANDNTNGASNGNTMDNSQAFARPIDPFSKQSNDIFNPQQVTVTNMPTATPTSEPGGITASSDNKQSGNPLDDFLKKPDNSNINGNQFQPQNPTPQQAQPQQAQPQSQRSNLFDTPVADYQNLLNKHTFVPELTAENLASMQQDPSVISKFVNDSIISGMATLAAMMGQINKKGIESEFSRFSSESMPSILNSYTYQQGWNSVDNDILKHPAVESIAKVKINELSTQFPEATPDQILDKTREFFETFSKQFTQNSELQNEEVQQRSNQKTSIEQFFSAS